MAEGFASVSIAPLISLSDNRTENQHDEQFLILAGEMIISLTG
jgi:hypothetical protein